MLTEIINLMSNNFAATLATATLIWAIISFIISKRKELAWKKTEFICAQCQFLDTDPVLSEMVMILENRHSQIKIADLYDDKSRLDKSLKNDYEQKFDILLNFLWRLCYAYTDLKTLNKPEIVSIGWYLKCISNHPHLLDYCQRNGYTRILQVIKKINLIPS